MNKYNKDFTFGEREINALKRDAILVSLIVLALGYFVISALVRGTNRVGNEVNDFTTSDLYMQEVLDAQNNGSLK